MGIINRVKSIVLGFSAGQHFSAPLATDASATTGNTKKFVNFVTSISDFSSLPEEEIYENMYKFTAEVGGSIDRFASMVRESFKYFYVETSQNYDNLIDFKSENIEFNITQQDLSLTEEMKDMANNIARMLYVKDLYESYAEILYLYGMIVLEKNGLSYIILPNSKVTILDDLARIGGSIDDEDRLITESNYLVIDEGEDTQREISRNNFVIKKFRDTPIHFVDKKGRKTFGIYATSPLQRAIIPVWQQRLILINDMLWRNKNVPREHHQINAEGFSNPSFYQGTPQEMKSQMDGAVSTYLENYKNTVTNQPSDMMYITTDGVEIKSIEHQGTSYMSPNDLLNQISSQIWSSLNIPRSIVEGSSNSTYASELIISSYTGMRVKQTAEKIGDIILQNIKARLLLINPSYPVELLRIKHEFTLENNRLENMKMAAVAGSLNSYTRSEIREMGSGSAPLSPEQLKGDIIINTSAKADAESLGKESSNKTPTTPESRNQQPTTVKTSQSDTAIYDK